MGRAGAPNFATRQTILPKARGVGRGSIFWSIGNVVVVFRCFSAKQDYCYKFGEG